LSRGPYSVIFNEMVDIDGIPSAAQSLWKLEFPWKLTVLAISWAQYWVLALPP
jgi:hypothetical protein